MQDVMMLSYNNGTMEAHTEEIILAAEKLEASSYKVDMPTERKEEFEVVAMKTGAKNNEKNLPAGGIILEDAWYIANEEREDYNRIGMTAIANSFVVISYWLWL